MPSSDWIDANERKPGMLPKVGIGLKMYAHAEEADRRIAKRDRRTADLEWQIEYDTKMYEQRLAQRDRLIDELEAEHRERMRERDELIRELVEALKSYETSYGVHHGAVTPGTKALARVEAHWANKK